MWRMIKAAFIGVVIGVVGGAIVGPVYYLKYFYNEAKKEEKDAIHALVYSNDSLSYEAFIADGLEIDSSDTGLLDGLEGEDTNSYTKDLSVAEQFSALPEIIQLEVIYNGAETLSAEEMAELQIFVKQAVLYALTEKLGENYNQIMEKAEVRKNLILSMEYINEAAKESAQEWGVDVDSYASFDYQYMQEGEVDGILCPAGYYEVFNIYLTE